MIAVRDNEQGAAAFTVSPAVTKLAAFAVAGGLAALAGGLLAGARVQFAALNFGPEESLRIVSMAIIGGLGSIAGSVLGAVYVLGLPALIQDSPEVRLLTSGVGLLILLLYFPGGLAQLLYRARDALVDLAARRVVPSSPPPQQRATAATIGTDEPAGTPDVVLRASGVTVRFGGRTALESVTFELPAAKIVGLIGANGAGKSTLVGAMAGSVRIDEGRIELLGSDVTDHPAHERARMGLGRVFQDARLFGDLTVRESVKLALEARERSELVPSMLGLPPARRAERRKAREAAELVAFLGLGRYADAFVSDLSTGTRRITELACLAALRPRVILLDEPTAGVAQREAEAFGPLIESIATELDASLVLIEHDIPLVMSISDRVYCLEAGSVISQGTPQKVRNDPRVIVAYLGTDERAIRRSDARRRRRSTAKV
jgi:ABC-type branched-subunit amino acid transport system ATPase component